MSTLIHDQCISESAELLHKLDLMPSEMAMAANVAVRISELVREDAELNALADLTSVRRAVFVAETACALALIGMKACRENL